MLRALNADVLPGDTDCVMLATEVTRRHSPAEMQTYDQADLFSRQITLGGLLGVQDVRSGSPNAYGATPNRRSKF